MSSSLPFPFPKAITVTDLYVLAETFNVDISFLKRTSGSVAFRGYLALILQPIWVLIELLHSFEAEINTHIYACTQVYPWNKFLEVELLSQEGGDLKLWCIEYMTIRNKEKLLHFSFPHTISNPSANAVYLQNRQNLTTSYHLSDYHHSGSSHLLIRIILK